MKIIEKLLFFICGICLAFYIFLSLSIPQEEIIPKDFDFKSSVIGEFYSSNEIIIERQDYIDSYFDWSFVEINKTHWIVNFSINKDLWNNITYCISLTNPIQKLQCWQNVKDTFFQDYNLTTLIEHLTQFLNKTYPMKNLTENIDFKDFEIDLTEGKASFYIIFPEGFKENERAKFGFGTTIISTATLLPWYTNQRTICRDSSNNIHVVWRYNSSNIRYAKSTDNGQTWLVNTTFYGATSNSSSTKYFPHISCDGNNITVSYEDYTADDLIVGISSDNGVTWTWKNPVTSNVYGDYGVVQNERRGQNIYVTYYNNSKGVYLVKSTDGGATWTPEPGILVSTVEGTPMLSIAVNRTDSSSDKIYVVFKDLSDNDIYFVNSTDSGNTWGSKIVLHSGSELLYYPSITFSGTNLYVTYDNGSYIYFINSTNEGINWNTPYLLETVGTTRYPVVTIDNKGNPWIFFQDNNLHSNYDIAYRKYNGTTWEDKVFITNDNKQNVYPSTKWNFSGDRIEFLWRNGTTSPYNIMYDYISLADIQAPQYSLNSTNSTLAGSAVEHRLKWTDDTALSHAIFSFDNCTGEFQNISEISLSGNQAWSNFTVIINSTVGCSIKWKVYTNDTSNNWNISEEFTYVTTSECSLAIGLSNTLASSITFGNTNPGEIKDALGNNGNAATDYYVTVSISGCNPNTANVYIKASGDLTSESYTIPLANFKFRNSTTDNTVPSSLQNISLTTSYSDNRIGSLLSDGSYVYLKFVLTAPSGQRPGNYSNTVYFWGGRSDLSPP